MSSLKEDVQFIFSNDCPVGKQSKYISIAGTILFWLSLLICALVIPAAKPKQKYKTVQIVISSPDKKNTKKVEAAAAEKPNAAPAEKTLASAETSVTPLASAKVEQPETETKTSAAKTSQKTQQKATSKTETKPSSEKVPAKKAEVVEYAMDMSDGVNFNAPAKKKTVSWDDIEFADDTAQTSESSATQTVTTKSELSGSAGTQGTAAAAKTSTKSNSTTGANSVSSDVKNSLGAISDAKVAGNSTSTAGSDNVKTSVNNGDFNWTDGRARSMWYPASPEIKISKENSPGVNRDVEITFTVTDMGVVTNIQFVQNALLSEGLKNEIRKQISTWRFDEADVSSSAKFLLKIRTK